MPLASLLALALVLPSAGGPEPTEDPREAEAERLLEAVEAEAGPSEPGPVEFARSPWASALLAGGAAALTGTLYAAAIMWGAGVLTRQLSEYTGLLLLVGFFCVPFLPAPAAALAVFTVQPWWTALAVGGATLLAGAVAAGVGIGLIFAVGPLVEEPRLFMFVVGLGLPVGAAIASAAATAGLTPWITDLVEQARDPRRARRSAPILLEE